MIPHRSRLAPAVPSSAFKGFRFPPEIIVLALRWYLRYGLSYRGVEELLAERRIEVDHVTVYRWVQRFTPLLADAAGPCRHSVGDRWYVDETHVKVAGRWRYVCRAIDQYGQIVDVYVSTKRDIRAARRFLTAALRAHGQPAEVVTDRAPALRAVIDELIPAAFHNTDQYANNRIECDHGRLKSRLRPMRGLKHDRPARVIIRGHALMQNVRRGHYETRCRCASPSSRRGCVYRTRRHHLNRNPHGLGPTHPDPAQRNRARLPLPVRVAEFVGQDNDSHRGSWAMFRCSRFRPVFSGHRRCCLRPVCTPFRVVRQDGGGSGGSGAG